MKCTWLNIKGQIDPKIAKLSVQLMFSSVCLGKVFITCSSASILCPKEAALKPRENLEFLGNV